LHSGKPHVEARKVLEVPWGPKLHEVRLAAYEGILGRAAPIVSGIEVKLIVLDRVLGDRVQFVERGLTAAHPGRIEFILILRDFLRAGCFVCLFVPQEFLTEVQFSCGSGGAEKSVFMGKCC
jgi:hypothetical protein